MGLKKRLAALLACAMAVAVAAVAGLGTASAESNGGVKVMPLGDSITDGFNVPGGYRTELWKRLVASGYTVDFVGPQYNGPAELGDHDHAGYTGWEINQIDAQVVGWLQTHQPRTIMLMIGTNDILHNIDVANAPSRLSALLDHILTTLPQVHLFVASITPLGGSFASYESAVQTYNASVPTIVSAKVSAGYQVHYVNMHSVLTTADLADGIHPSATGYTKMGDAWYSALTSVPASLTGGSTPSPGTSSSSAASSPSTSGSAGSGTKTCAAAYRLVGQWSGGFQGEVSVTAGSAAISGWTVTWTFSSGQTITQSWNATITTSGSTVTASNVAYNGSLAAGTSAVFGFLGGFTSANPVPTLTCTAR
ncbi:MAG: cellulose binding domain-containing protein [Micromonosporaceae bacterium]|nr:cellulose binding domain-containing protein [Micromonosporaceae bacterium]